jgi:hypothetical protein
VLGSRRLHLQWSRNGRNTVHATNDTHVCGTLSEGHSARDDQDSTGKDSSSAHTSDGAADDKCSGIRCETTNQRADLEDEQSSDINPLYGIEGIKLAIDQLRGAGG